MAGQKTDARDVHVGQRIAELRKRASLTQKRVAQSFGMSAAQLQKYEKGTNRISAIHLETFSRMIGVPVEYFFDGMERADDLPSYDPIDAKRAAQDGDEAWRGLVDVVSRYVTDHFSERHRRDLSAVIHALDRKLGG